MCPLIVLLKSFKWHLLEAPLRVLFFGTRQSCAPVFLFLLWTFSKISQENLFAIWLWEREKKNNTNHLTNKKEKSSYVRAEKCLTTIIKLRPFLASDKTNWNRINLPTLKSNTKFYICASFTLHFGKFHWMNGNKVFYAHEAVFFSFFSPNLNVTIQSFFHKWFVNNTQKKKRMKLFLEQKTKFTPLDETWISTYVKAQRS